MRAPNKTERKGMRIRNEKMIGFDEVELFLKVPFRVSCDFDGVEFSLSGFAPNDMRRRYVVIAANDTNNDLFSYLELDKKKEYFI